MPLFLHDGHFDAFFLFGLLFSTNSDTGTANYFRTAFVHIIDDLLSGNLILILPCLGIAGQHKLPLVGK